MQIIDTHAHLYVAKFDEDIAQVIARAKETGVKKILLPNIDTQSIAPLHRLAESYPNYCIPMMGLHPTSVKEDWKTQLAVIEKQFAERKYIAVGEIGIDLYWDKIFYKEQQQAFEQQLGWSIKYNLPVAIHTREATQEAIESIKKTNSKNLRGVFHSFVGTAQELQAILSLQNFYIGINGVVTYKNSDLDQVLLNTDLSRIVIETDAPYLSPVPYRGKRNESSYTQHIVEKLACIFNTTAAEVAAITTQNAQTLFNLE